MKILYEENLFGDLNDYVAFYQNDVCGEIVITDLRYNFTNKTVCSCVFYEIYKDVFEKDFIDNILKVVNNE